MITEKMKAFMKGAMWPCRKLPVYPFNDNLLLWKKGCFCSSLLFIGILYCLIDNFTSNFRNSLRIRTVLSNIQVYTIFFTYTSCLVIYLINHKDISALYFKFLRLHKALKNEGHFVRYSIWRTAVFNGLSIFILTLEGCSAYFSMRCQSFFYVNVTHNLPYFLTHIMSCPLRAFFIIVDSQLATLIEGLELNKKTVDTYRIDKIEYICSLQTVLCDLCKKLNDIYSYYFLFEGILTFSLSVLSMFFLAQINLSHDIHIFRLVGLNITNILYVFLWILEILYDTTFCEIISAKALEFNHSLHTLFYNDETGLIYGNKKILSHLQKMNCVHFSAAGFFDFSYQILTSSLLGQMVFIIGIMVVIPPEILASCTTYFIVLIQFVAAAQPLPLEQTTEATPHQFHS